MEQQITDGDLLLAGLGEFGNQLADTVAQPQLAALDQHHDAGRGGHGLGDGSEVKHGVRRHGDPLGFHLAIAVGLEKDDLALPADADDTARHLAGCDALGNLVIDPLQMLRAHSHRIGTGVRQAGERWARLQAKANQHRQADSAGHRQSWEMSERRPKDSRRVTLAVNRHWGNRHPHVSLSLAVLYSALSSSRGSLREQNVSSRAKTTERCKQGTRRTEFIPFRCVVLAEIRCACRNHLR